MNRADAQGGGRRASADSAPLYGPGGFCRINPGWRIVCGSQGIFRARDCCCRQGTGE